jgi:hypothetical protein
MFGLRFTSLRSLISDFGFTQNLWNCPPKYILIYEYCNVYLELVLPTLILSILLVGVFICRFIPLFDGKHKIWWNHASSIWWLTGMSLGISAFNGISSSDNIQLVTSAIICAIFMVFSLILGFKIV